MPADSFVADFIAGWAGGGAGLLLGHPLDTIKVRLQALKGYKTAMQCIKQTLRQEAIGGFYKGMFFPFMSTGLLHSVYFGGYGITVKLLKDPNTSENGDAFSPFGHLLASSVAGAMFQWIPACPVEIVKVKLQVQKDIPTSRLGETTLKLFVPAHQWKVQPNIHASGDRRIVFSNPWDCLRQTVRREGIAGLYRGGLIMLIRDVLGFIFYMPVYEHIKYYLITPTKLEKTDENAGRKSSISKQRRLTASLIAGGLAGIASWIPILPFDLIKSRLQADDIGRPKYQGIWHCAKESFRKEGITVFFRGWQLVAIRAFPVNAVVFLCYDETIRLLNHIL